MSAGTDHLHDNIRHPDYTTSVAGALAPGKVSQRNRLLMAWDWADLGGLTNGEACLEAGLNTGSCYWKRADELRSDGLIEWQRDQDGVIINRPNPLLLPERHPQGVSIITEVGQAAARALVYRNVA